MSKKQDQQNAITELNNILANVKTDTIYTVLRHVSASGMQREISVKLIDNDGRISHLDWLVSQALDMKLGRQGVKVRGCGMDMGFHLVYNLIGLCADGRKFRHEWL